MNYVIVLNIIVCWWQKHKTNVRGPWGHWRLGGSLKASVLTGGLASVWNPRPTITVAFKNRQLGNCVLVWKQGRFKLPPNAPFHFPHNCCCQSAFVHNSATQWTPVEAVRDRAPTCVVLRLQRRTQSSPSEFLKRDLEGRGCDTDFVFFESKRKLWGFLQAFLKAQKKGYIQNETNSSTFVEKLYWKTSLAGRKYRFGEHCHKPQLQLQSAPSVVCTVDVGLINDTWNNLMRTKHHEK